MVTFALFSSLILVGQSSLKLPLDIDRQYRALTLSWMELVSELASMQARTAGHLWRMTQFLIVCLIHGLHCFYHSEWLCYEVFLTPTFFASCTTSFLHTVLLHFCGSVEFSELSKPKGLNRNIPLSHLAPLPGWH